MNSSYCTHFIFIMADARKPPWCALSADKLLDGGMLRRANCELELTVCVLICVSKCLCTRLEFHTHRDAEVAQWVNMGADPCISHGLSFVANLMQTESITLPFPFYTGLLEKEGQVSCGERCFRKCEGLQKEHCSLIPEGGRRPGIPEETPIPHAFSGD